MDASVSTTKPAGYYGLERADVVAELPQPIGRALDVGCGEGGVGRSLRAAGATWVSGIEIVPAAAEVARGVLDEVFVGSVEAALEDGALAGPFDTICCYDVLEHLADPEPVLRALRSVAAPGARLHVSIPNARHFSLLLDLVFRGTFGYAEFGHRDATHLRWFTRRDIVELLESTGWRVDDVQTPVLKRRYRAAAAVSGGFAKEFLTIQWYVLARRAG
jgi:O-antigen biosynthesis protein